MTHAARLRCLVGVTARHRIGFFQQQVADEPRLDRHVIRPFQGDRPVGERAPPLVAWLMALVTWRGSFVALIEQAAVIQRILRHLGLPPEIPAPNPARAPPLSLDTGPPSVDDNLTDFDPGR